MTLQTTGDSGLMSFGQTQLDPGDLIMPRVKLLQAQSTEVADGEGKPGDFLNTLTTINYGPTLRFVPISPFKQRIFLVRSEKRAVVNAALAEGGLEELGPDAEGLRCRSYDMIHGTGSPGIACEACPLSKWDDLTPPLCTETYNVAAATDEGELIVLSFSRSSARVGKQLFSMIRMRPGARQTIFEAASKSEKGKLGNYSVPVIKPLEMAPPELVRQVNTWAAQLQGVTIDVTPEEVGDDADTESGPF